MSSKLTFHFDFLGPGGCSIAVIMCIPQHAWHLSPYSQPERWVIPLSWVFFSGNFNHLQQLFNRNVFLLIHSIIDSATFPLITFLISEATQLMFWFLHLFHQSSETEKPTAQETRESGTKSIVSSYMRIWLTDVYLWRFFIRMSIWQWASQTDRGMQKHWGKYWSLVLIEVRLVGLDQDRSDDHFNQEDKHFYDEKTKN